MPRVAILNVVGLTEGHLGPRLPRITAYARAGAVRRIDPVLPAVTCTAQSTYLTGLPPGSHGAVANGWYDRGLSEVHFWKQSNHVVQGRKLWEELRERTPGFTCAKLFWWYNMYSSADYSITPRPMYPADGRKVFDIYSWPPDLRPGVKQELGEFPFPGFWGPAAGLPSPAGGRDCATRWIAGSARWVEEQHGPTLNLVYLPHLDYNLQRLGPGDPAVARDFEEIDQIVGDLIDLFDRRGVEVILLSEYGITPVSRPVHVNRALREAGLLTVREELGLELLDPGNSLAFAVADHQVAHVYVNDPGVLPEVRRILEALPGVGELLDAREQESRGLRHPRAGDLIAVAAPDAWFTYYYWLEDRRAPDFARCVDIHRKPGYDPVELFIDPALRAPKLRIAWKLLRKALGFRMLMDLIPLDAGLVKGSHGARPMSPRDFPVLILPREVPALPEVIPAEGVYGVLRNHLLGPAAGGRGEA
ncbi:MAG TPA: alkaline phosphatase family protein [Verrucomicrobiales bacterium]|nr:alkaline phosphatase family protein [Verrucomicrobiales bacterium]